MTICLKRHDMYISGILTPSRHSESKQPPKTHRLPFVTPTAHQANKAFPDRWRETPYYTADDKMEVLGIVIVSSLNLDFLFEYNILLFD